MAPRTLVLLAGLVACSGSPGDTPTSATTPTGASATDTAAPGTGSGETAAGVTTSGGPDEMSTGDAGGPTAMADPPGDPTTTGVDPTTGDDGGSTSAPGTTSGPMQGCGDVDYFGYCDGDVLVWCEEEMLKMVDCAADGRICVYANDTIGNDCVFPPDPAGGFGYPVGDRATSPAGGWTVTQVLAHYYDVFGGGHLAHDVAAGEAQTANAPVYSVADGLVRYAGPNNSTYVHVVLIEHTYAGDQKICSFYGHLNAPNVTTGQTVARGDQVATILDQSGNSHLHYVMLSPALCDASAAANGALICGYDGTQGYNGVNDLSDEPAVYTALPNVCGNENYPDGFLSPTKFIDAHHF